MQKYRVKLKFIFLLIASLSSILWCFSQNPIGAWERYYEDEKGTNIRSVVIFSEKFQSIVMFNADSGEFIYSNGGTWELNENMMTEKVEFDTENSERVGETVTFKVEITNNKLSLPDANWNFNRIDDGTPGDLNGTWLMSGRYRNGEKQMRSTDRPRKTMKILSGTRFQWIAFDTEKKEFKGTGGGIYTTLNGKYFEKIEFFSRDDTRVGMNLEFNYNLENGEWNHKGKTSKGDPLHEIWIKRKK
tara:strand:- start:84 stop:818 length:735 start_codon:yes stop_codon:yes gene_type:complete